MVSFRRWYQDPRRGGRPSEHPVRAARARSCPRPQHREYGRKAPKTSRRVFQGGRSGGDLLRDPGRDGRGFGPPIVGRSRASARHGEPCRPDAGGLGRDDADGRRRGPLLQGHAPAELSRGGRQQLLVGLASGLAIRGNGPLVAGSGPDPVADGRTVRYAARALRDRRDDGRLAAGRLRAAARQQGRRHRQAGRPDRTRDVARRPLRHEPQAPRVRDLAQERRMGRDRAGRRDDPARHRSGRAPDWLLVLVAVLQAAVLLALVDGRLRRRWVDTYQALWGPDPIHPGNRRVTAKPSRHHRQRSLR